MSDLYDLIQKIQKRPSMYLGKPHISNLRSCLAGYNLARRELGIPQTKHEQEFVEFKNWIKKKFNISTGQSWDNIILFYSEDERTALNNFFELFQEFTQESGENGKHKSTEDQVESPIL
ncbi:MAG: hypothetical protein RIM23_25805 [Coleofasciculus sp. G3-WIS-01]|uniref:hypothetical protein n=1 Tax=Coleofasciculus sp. G3-WIS-01 TaxID=3069528 RepID=UPI0032FEB9F9